MNVSRDESSDKNDADDKTDDTFDSDDSSEILSDVSSLTFDGDYAETDDSEDEVEQYEEPKTVTETLAEWGIEMNVSLNKVRDLLGRLQVYHPELPKDPRTLFKTSTIYDIISVSGGSYHHFGLRNCLIRIVDAYDAQRKGKRMPLGNLVNFYIQFNIDGLPLHNSTSNNFWPILARVVSPLETHPFVVGLWYGTGKPSDLNFLNDFCKEFTQLSNGFIYKNVSIHPKIHSIIADAPATAMIKGIKTHNAYYGCGKCITRGEWFMNRMTFPTLNEAKRQNIQFRFPLLRAHRQHLQETPSPLQGLPVDMVLDFPIDYMHLVCLGGTKRLLTVLMKGPNLSQRLKKNVVQEISDKLKILQAYTPNDFSRKPRSLEEVAHWKATEFRLFLLYIGPVALKDSLSSDQYDNFMIFSVAVTCLIDPQLCSETTYIRTLLKNFIEHLQVLYRPFPIVYNLHCLYHLADDANRFGNLDQFSGFPFENHLGILKKLIRSPSNPLAQAIRRLSEKDSQNILIKKRERAVVSQEHDEGPLPVRIDSTSVRQYRKIELPLSTNGSITTAEPNHCIMVNNEPSLVQNIFVKDNKPYIVYKRFLKKSNFFKYPLESSIIGIYTVCDLGSVLHIVDANHITCKCLLLPYCGMQVVLPIRHYN